MATTTSYTEKTGYLSLTEINAAFAEIATVLNAKLDREDAAEYTASGALTRDGQIINLPYAVADDEPVPLAQFEELS